VEYVDSIRRTCAGSASTGPAASTPPTTSSALRLRRVPDREGKAYVCDLTDEEIRAYRGTLPSPAGPAPTATARWPRTSTCSAACAPASSPTARGCCARRSTWPPNMNLRDPLLYRIRHAHHHRTGARLVHLPDVRLRARPVRRDRGHHPLDLHARVRGPPAALRLVPGQDTDGRFFQRPRPGRSSSRGSTSPTRS
jgi:hypothetical protein